MPCLVALLALISPRLAIIFVAIFSDILTRSFDGSWLLPLIGFFLLPWTTLSWALLWSSGANGVYGVEWFFVAFFFLLDLASYAGGARSRASSSTAAL